jgi:hypothetical protein
MTICPVGEGCPIWPVFRSELKQLKDHLKRHKTVLKNQPRNKCILLFRCLDSYRLLQQCCVCCQCDLNCIPCFGFEQINHCKQILEYLISMRDHHSYLDQLQAELWDLNKHINKRAIIKPD